RQVRSGVDEGDTTHRDGLAIRIQRPSAVDKVPADNKISGQRLRALRVITEMIERRAAARERAAVHRERATSAVEVAVRHRKNAADRDIMIVRGDIERAGTERKTEWTDRKRIFEHVSPPA